MPYFETTIGGTCDDVPTNDDEFGKGFNQLAGICQDKRNGEIVCLCVPGSQCQQPSVKDVIGLISRGGVKDQLATRNSNPTDLLYRKICRVCKDVGMVVRECEEEDGCPKDE